MYPVHILYHNVRSAHNVGALFRTADGAGVKKVYLTGYTPTPSDRFGRVQKDIAKTALGAERIVSWKYKKNPLAVIQECKKDGWSVVGVEQDSRSIPYTTYSITQPTLLIFGNEVRGLSPRLRAQCDLLIDIPMRGSKESLNVSVATGIVAYYVTDQ